MWYPEDDKELPIPDSDLLYIGSPKFEILRADFEKNIKKIIAAARRRSIPVIFLESVAKWRGYEPVRSFHGEALKGDALAGWNAMFDRAGKAFTTQDYAVALDLYKKCVEADPDYALTYYRIAQTYEALGDPAKANEYYTIANDHDRYLIRAPSTVNAFYETILADPPKDVYVIRTQKVFEGSAADGVIGDDLIGDQIHPSVDGQALIALEIVKTIYKAGMVAPKSEWRWQRLRSAEEMKNELRFSAAAELEIDLAIAGYLQKEYRKSVGFLEKAAKLSPDSIFINSWLAWTYWKLGDLERSLGLYRKLYRDSPSAALSFLERHPDIRSALAL
jgi:tetratricopeptide (TPR) repeat protein